MDRRLYEASLSGSVPTLNKLMQEDELILDRVSLTCFHETPLHIAAMRGHLSFTQVLLSQNPQLTTEVDSLGRSPLHLASAKGHVEIVRELLSINSDVCGDRDQDGRTPLHLAVMNGRVEVIKELIQTRPELAYDILGRGETVLHLCVRYYRLKALKYLVESIKNKEFVNSKDGDGNTILHLAAIFKQMETIKYLFSKEEVKENANAKTVNGLTALDVLDHCPRDVKVMEMREFLLEAGVGRAINNHVSQNIMSVKSSIELDDVRTSMEHRSTDVLLHRSISRSLVTVPPSSTSGVIRRICMNFLSALKKVLRFICVNWNEHFKINSGWLEESRGNVMVVATVITTMSFQAGVNPPGGVWQDRINGVPGTSILQTRYPTIYEAFLRYNTSSLVASLGIILLMISGFPLKNKFSMWLLIAAMSAAVAFISLAYIQSLFMIFSTGYVDDPNQVLILIWVLSYGIVILIHSINFLVWVVKTSRKFLIGIYMVASAAWQ